MTSFHCFARAAGCFALTAAASLAHATERPAAPNPADPDAAVPAVRYQPAMRYHVEAGQTTPAQNWKALNDQVGTIDSMSLTMAEAPAAQPDAAPQVAPPAAPARHAPESQHQHHQHHQHGKEGR